MRIVLRVIFVKREDKLQIRVRLIGVQLEDNSDEEDAKEMSAKRKANRTH